MSISATAVHVFLASPGDTDDERAAIRRAIFEWTAFNFRDTGIAMIPVNWEDQATPESGDKPQNIINRQLLDTSDAVVAVFKTRTGAGTLEEIERSIEAKKPVLIYLYRGSLPNDVDTSALEELRAFRARISGRCLFVEFSDVRELEKRISRDLTGLQRMLTATQPTPSASSASAEWRSVARELYRRAARGVRQLPALLSPLQWSTGDESVDEQRFNERAAEIAAVLNSFHQMLYDEKPILPKEVWIAFEKIDAVMRECWNGGMLGKQMGREMWQARERSWKQAREALPPLLESAEELLRKNP